MSSSAAIHLPPVGSLAAFAIPGEAEVYRIEAIDLFMGTVRLSAASRNFSTDVTIGHACQRLRPRAVGAWRALLAASYTLDDEGRAGLAADNAVARVQAVEIVPTEAPAVPTLNRGDKVRVTRKVTECSDGRNAHWSPMMDGAVGRVGTVRLTSAEHAQGLVVVDLKKGAEEWRGCWSFAAEALELVADEAVPPEAK